MKHTPRLSGEPPSLTAYRTANPEDVAADGTDAEAVWNRFRDDAAYKDVRDQLLTRQQGLCIYCEQRVTLETGQLVMSDQQIEHVLAKSGAAGRTLDWTNFALCCGGGTYRYHRDATRYLSGKTNVSCGQSKGDSELGAGCDPRTFPLNPRLVNVGLDGELTADVTACGAVGIDPGELNRTINTVLNLNCERLKLARSKTVDNILNWFVSLQDELFKLTYGQPHQIQQMKASIAGLRLQPDDHGHLRAFWSTERQYLEPWSSEWISMNLQLLGGAVPAAGSQGAA